MLRHIRDSYLRQVQAPLTAPKPNLRLLDGTKHMTTRPDTALRPSTATFTTRRDLLRYFIDELDIGRSKTKNRLEDEDIEELTFEWDLEELGIPRRVRRPVERLRQVRPFTETQPWGIFFVELTAQRLLIGQIRKILNKLVTRGRATARDPNQRSWALDNLIFVVTTGSGDSTELHLLVFFDVDGRTEFRCLTWRPTDSTRRIRRLAQELLPHLAWPHEEDNTEAWRTAWRAPFTQQPGDVIRTAARLVDRMSRTAVDLRSQIRQALAEEGGEGPFTALMNDIRQQLVADVDEERFSDMCAQTLVYGLLGSRVSDPDGFGATPVLSAVPLSNPFLSAFFEHVHGEAVELDLEGSGLGKLTADLRVSNVEAILDDFGSTAKGGDPVIHFYEEFLKKYDPKMRADAGAFFTPEPIVEFMVRGVDHLLRTRFGLDAGVADATTWGQVAERFRFDVPEGVDPHKPFISMVDPAVGTGTFLVHWLRQAKRSFTSTHQDASWPQHLADTVLPTVHAFELMLAPYAISHLKLALRLHDERLPTDTAQLLLTDTLDHDPPQLRLDGLDDPVAAEGRAAARLKTSERFTVVIGNPPYDREQHAVGDTGKRKGGVVRHGAAGFEPLINDLTEPMSQAGLGVHIKNLYNDYVYFWRWAVWQATELPPGPGIVAFITASSYLAGISMGGVRSLLRHAFDELILVDLGGEGRGALVEENVFDIRTPVAIAFGIRRRVSDEPCTVHYTRIFGTRQEKFDQLRDLSVEDVTIDVPGEGLEILVPRTDADYWYWPSLANLFPWRHTGGEFKRTWPIGPTEGLLNKRWNTLVTAIPRDRTDLLRDTGYRTILSTPKPLLRPGSRLHSIRSLDRGDPPEGIERYGYRSFDRQWAIADNRVADRPRPDLWRVRGRGQLFLTTMTTNKLGKGPVLTITPYTPDRHHFSGRGGKDAMPLYRDRAAREPNLPDGLLETLSRNSRDTHSSRRHSRLHPRAPRYKRLQRAVHRRASRNGRTRPRSDHPRPGPIQPSNTTRPRAALAPHLGGTVRTRPSRDPPTRQHRPAITHRQVPGNIPVPTRRPDTPSRKRAVRPRKPKSVELRSLGATSASFLARLPKGQRKGEEVKRPRRHTPQHMGLHRRTTTPHRHPPTHNRPNPHRRPTTRRHHRRSPHPRKRPSRTDRRRT